MHPPTDESLSSAKADDGRPWWQLLNSYHWFVFAIAAFGWLFDTMDQQLFNIARIPAMRALIEKPAEPVGAEPGMPPTAEQLTAYENQMKDYHNAVARGAGSSTMIFLIGWGTGGLIFGVIGDLLGRVKALSLTILMYSLFTGLSAFATDVATFSLYRFLTGLGVGGEFAVGVSLVAEVMPDRARPFALGMLQALSAVGNITAACIAIVLAYLAKWHYIGESWRIMFIVGAVPALLTFLILRRLKEPERWKQVAAQLGIGRRIGSYFGELFENPRWARNAIVGLLLASSGIIGLWGIGFFSIDLQRIVFRARLEAAHVAPEEVNFQVDIWAGWTSVMLNLGAFFGIYAFSRVTHYTGRKPAFAVSFVLALLSTAFVFWKFQSITDIFWMIPIMGFCQLALFGGYAIYFPELFPTRLRSTGTSFCYNGARFVAAAGPQTLGFLTGEVFAAHGHTEAIRYAGISMCAVFLIGLLVLPFAPETNGQPLPE
jgi:MFS family permease